MDIFEVKQQSTLASGINAMQVKECKWCGQNKAILSKGKFLTVYKHCTCEESMKALKEHDKKILNIKLKSKEVEYYAFVEKAKNIKHGTNGKWETRPDTWEYNVKMLFAEYIGHDEEMMQKTKDIYVKSCILEGDFNNTPELYFKKLAGLYLNLLSSLIKN